MQIWAFLLCGCASHGADLSVGIGAAALEQPLSALCSRFAEWLCALS